MIHQDGFRYFEEGEITINNGVPHYKGIRFSRMRSARFKRAKDISTHKKEEWAKMLRFFNNTCVSCERDDVYIEKDHIIPIYQGGSDSIRNIQPMCARCNSSKGPDCNDYRLDFCVANSIEMPDEWKLFFID